MVHQVFSALPHDPKPPPLHLKRQSERHKTGQSVQAGRLTLARGQ